MIAPDIRIVIIGAGIAGLSAAAALRKFGFDAVIYEQAHRFARVGAGIQLTPNAMKAVRGFGLEERLRAVSFAPEQGYNRRWDTGEVTFIHPMGAYTENRYGAPDLSMHRADLHAALESLVPPEVIHYDHRLVGLDRTAEGIRLTFENGKVVIADALIGADGIHSVIRETIVGKEELDFTGQVAYRTVYPSALLPRAIDDRVKWWGEGRHIVTYKVSPNRDALYFIASTPEPDFHTESWSAPGDVATLCKAYEGFHPDARIILESAPSVHKWALIERRPLDCWTDDRTILIGDAAHPMLPYMAQGAGVSIEDAIVLARCLTDGNDIDEAFRRCEAHRRPRTTRIQLGAKENLWMRTQSMTDTDWVYGYDAWHAPLG